MNKIFTFILILTFSLEANMFVPTNDSSLQDEVDEIDSESINSVYYQGLIKKLSSLADAKRRSHNMVGLSANQFGIHKPIIFVDTSFEEGKKVNLDIPLEIFINPKIKCYGETCHDLEGCFSIEGMVGMVPRYRFVDMIAYDDKGNLVERTFEGLTARIVQHEVDHLKGIRFPDRMNLEDGQDLHFVGKEEMKTYRSKIENWDKVCSKKEWESIKNG